MPVYDNYRWCQDSIDEDSLFERLDVMGKGLVCLFGSGTQGAVYMTEDGGFAKITMSLAEVALAKLIKDYPVANMPIIEDVLSFEFDGRTMYVIYREGLDDLIEVTAPDDKYLARIATGAWTDLHMILPPKTDSYHVLALAQDDPKLHRELVAFANRLNEMPKEEGINVLDLAFDNLGRSANGSICIRDFGHNMLSKEEVVHWVSKIEPLPHPFGSQMSM